MKKVLLYSFLLILGLSGSQVLPAIIGDAYESLAHLIQVLTMVGLAFIMIQVELEFEIDKSNLRRVCCVAQRLMLPRHSARAAMRPGRS